ncbi:MAG: copper-binding protein [Micromonosporaceae bacterium]|nr:copper-binding protein [Micromonosporaceae bacterium]
MAAAVLLATACGGGDPGGGDQPTDEAQPTGARVDVTEDEFSIELSEPELTPGTYTFVIKNEGAVGHNLVIDGPGVSKAQTPLIRSGRTETVTVTLREGTYDVWCSIGNHRDQGMELTLSIGGAATPTPMTSPTGGDDGSY